MVQKTLRDSLQETEDAIHLDHIDDALAHCLHILEYFPESLETQRLLGEIYLAQGRLEEAQQAFDWVLTNDPEHVIAYCNRALVSERLSDFDTALDCYQQAYELSRGNGQIRQQFNQLSSRTGLPGFMLSRAGLARLYMRGDLLTQSIQEWESVLTATPDRLDARTGLLETYWRAGLYEQVVSLATQILQDVSGCVKALLLLAHVTAANNMQQAQDLLRRTEVVDPDLVMAQDLFSDLLASQPNDPFLRLLQKPPAYLDASGAAAPSSMRIPDDANASAYAPGSLGASLSSDNFAHWGNGTSGDNDTTWPSPQPGTSSPSVWSGNEISTSGMRNIAQGLTPLPEVPELVAQLRNDPTLGTSWNPSDQNIQTPQQDDAQLEPWQLLQEALHDMSPNAGQPQSQPQYEASQWELLGALSTSGSNATFTDESADEVAQAETAAPWTASPKEEKPSAPPAWLSMLTQTDKRQPASASQPQEEEVLPAVSEPIADADASAPPPWEVPQQETSHWDEKTMPQPPAAAEQDEDSFFGPEWLKSIGAASLDLETSTRSGVLDIPTPQEPQAAPVAQEPEPQATYEPWTFSQDAQPDLQASQDTWIQQVSPSETGQAEESWMEQLSRSGSRPAYDPWEAQTPAPEQEAKLAWMAEIADRQLEHEPASEAERAEQNLVTTLEELEKNLRSKGFIPMEPKTLSSIAQTQGAAPTDPSPAPMSSMQEEQEQYQVPSLSSALAELGHFAPQYQLPNPDATLPSALPEPFQLDVPAEPAWIAALRSTTPARAEAPEQVSSSQEAAVSGTAPVAEPARQKTNELPRVASTQADAPAAAVPSSVPQFDEPYETTKMAAISKKLLLGGELETTMKRPAVRLQSMQQRSYAGPGREPPALPAKGRYVERTVNKASDGNLSSRERLLKGYQSQLIGEYDEAMQEYRIVIRNAPELLGDVVSNVRALLKLAPKYSVGYRVLGDAYMRQGEYLQAMEAYNKALTMAKKIKS